jgi:predicted O-methyltransferase YrrM
MHPSELKQFCSFYASIPARDLFDIDKARLLRSVRSHTTLTWGQLSALYDAARRIERERIPGNVVECGVARGGSSAILSAALDSDHARHLWMFDSWESETGQNARDLLLRKLLLNPCRKHFVKGWFRESLPQEKSAIGKIALLHLDVGGLEAATYCLDQLYEQIVPGGMVLIDGHRRPRDARKSFQKTDAQFEITTSAALLLRKSFALPPAAIAAGA